HGHHYRETGRNPSKTLTCAGWQYPTRSSPLPRLQMLEHDSPVHRGKRSHCDDEERKVEDGKEEHHMAVVARPVHTEHDRTKDQIRDRFSEAANEMHAARILPRLVILVVRKRRRERDPAHRGTDQLPPDRAAELMPDDAHLEQHGVDQTGDDALTP